MGYSNTLKVCVTTGLGTNSVFYIASLLEAGEDIHTVLVQTNKYRKRRERRFLKEKGLSYLPTFLGNYLFYKVLKRPTTLRGYVYGLLWRSATGRRVIRRLKRGRRRSPGTKPVDKFEDITRYEHDFHTRIRMLKEIIQRKGLSTKIDLTPKINSRQVEEHLRSNAIDVLLISGGTIVRKRILEAVSLCALTVHNSYLPYLRGWGGGEVWALIRDQPEAMGMTVFYTDAGMDTGDILVREHLRVREGDSLRSLKYRNIRLGRDLILRALRLLVSGDAPRVKQEDAKATYINRHPNEEERALALRTLEKWKAGLG